MEENTSMRIIRAQVLVSTPTLAHLLNDGPGSAKLAQDGFHCIADCADQHCEGGGVGVGVGNQYDRLSRARHARTREQSGCEGAESQPFFSCRHREDRPAPLSGRCTSSPIHDASAFGTEPANEALRTADSKREGAITDKKYKISQMENHTKKKKV